MIRKKLIAGNLSKHYVCVKYNTVQDFVVAWCNGDLDLNTMKKNYYFYVKSDNPRASLYKQAIYEIEKIKLDMQWGEKSKEFDKV